MFSHIVSAHRTWQALGIVSTIAISLATASAALAGECPADKMKPNARQMVDYKPVGVTDVTLGSIDLGKQPAHIEGRELRFRKLTIEPGGIVPWHSHDDRPALIFVQQGEIVELGDVTPGRVGQTHDPKRHIEATAPSKALVTYCGRSDPCGRRRRRE